MMKSKIVKRKEFPSYIINHIYNHTNIYYNINTHTMSIYHIFKYVDGHDVSYVLPDTHTTEMIIK